MFAVNTNGTGFTTLHSFTAGGDGAVPVGLVLSGNTLYGTAYEGGSSGSGTVFAVNTNGTGFTTLYSFTQSGCYQQRRRVSVCRSDFIGQHPVWDDV